MRGQIEEPQAAQTTQQGKEAQQEGGDPQQEEDNHHNYNEYIGEDNTYDIEDLMVIEKKQTYERMQHTQERAARNEGARSNQD